MATVVRARPFGEWVAETRKAKGLTQVDLAERVGATLGVRRYSRDRIWDLENGSPKFPTPDLVTAVADALGEPVTVALEEMGYELPVADTRPVHPQLGGVLANLDWAHQERLASVLPGLLQLAAGLNPDNVLNLTGIRHSADTVGALVEPTPDSVGDVIANSFPEGDDTATETEEGERDVIKTRPGSPAEGPPPAAGGQHLSRVDRRRSGLPRSPRNATADLANGRTDR